MFDVTDARRGNAAELEVGPLDTGELGQLRAPPFAMRREQRRDLPAALDRAPVVDLELGELALQMEQRTARRVALLLEPIRAHAKLAVVVRRARLSREAHQVHDPSVLRGVRVHERELVAIAGVTPGSQFK